MPLWTFIVWIVIGLIAGVVASNLMGRPGRYGLLGDIVVGLIGACTVRKLRPHAQSRDFIHAFTINAFG